MGCIDGTTKEIISTCATQPVAGVEVKGWAGNRTELVPPTKTLSLIQTIQMKSGARLWPVTGVKKLFNPGATLVSAPDRADTYQHLLAFQGFELDNLSIENYDALADMFFIFELKHKANDPNGPFKGFGIENGMYKTALDWAANDLDAAVSIAMASEEGANEPYPMWTIDNVDYDTTLAMLVAQESVQP
jgi:hypothetical protein